MAVGRKWIQDYSERLCKWYRKNQDNLQNKSKFTWCNNLQPPLTLWIKMVFMVENALLLDSCFAASGTGYWIYISQWMGRTTSYWLGLMTRSHIKKRLTFWYLLKNLSMSDNSFKFPCYVVSIVVHNTFLIHLMNVWLSDDGLHLRWVVLNAAFSCCGFMSQLTTRVNVKCEISRSFHIPANAMLRKVCQIGTSMSVSADPTLRCSLKQRPDVVLNLAV